MKKLIVAVFVLFTLTFLLLISVVSQGQWLTKTSAASAGTIDRVAIAALGTKRVATAVRNGSGNLKVIVWNISDNDQITLGPSASAGAIDDVAITSLTPSRLVTAVRDGGGNLKLTVWDLFYGGNVVIQKGSASAGAISEVAIIRLTSFRVATAVRDGSGKLKVTIWDVDNNGLLQVKKGSASGEAISALNRVTITNLSSTRIVTAVADNNSNLKVTVWDLDANGAVLQKGINSAGAVSDLAIAPLENTGVITSVRNGAGNLQVIRWDVNANGAIVRRLGDGFASAISEVATVAAVNFNSLGVATAVRDGGGKLKLIIWGSHANGFSQEVDASAGLISRVAITGWMDGFVTAVRDGSNNLKVIVWSYELPPGLTSQLSENSMSSKNMPATRVLLGQNIPNPFQKSTAISYTLPQKFTTAQILITDQNGNVLKRTNVSGTGKGVLNIDASTFSSGTYTYSLVVDGHSVDTKKMVLVK